MSVVVVVVVVLVFVSESVCASLVRDSSEKISLFISLFFTDWFRAAAFRCRRDFFECVEACVGARACLLRGFHYQVSQISVSVTLH